MKIVSFKTLLPAGLVLLGWVFSAQTLASGQWHGHGGCFDPEERDTFVTKFGGHLKCPSDAYSECKVYFKHGQVHYKGHCDSINVSVDSNGGLNWNIDEDGDGVDAVLTESSRHKSCLYSYGTDQVEAVVGYQSSYNDFYHPKKAVFCRDGIDEASSIVHPPAKVEQCVIDFGESKLIHGVSFNCPAVPAGETRTILVSKDTSNCTDTGQTDPNGNPVYECDSHPGFGFTDETGNIDFNNVCQCVGPLVSGGGSTTTFPVLREECDPDPSNPEGCSVVNSEVPVEIMIQNPKCFTVGGRRRCF